MVAFKIFGFQNAKQIMPCKHCDNLKMEMQWRLLGRRRRISFVFRWLKYHRRPVKSVKIGSFSIEPGLKTTTARDSAPASDKCTSFMVQRAPGWCNAIYRCGCGCLGGTVMLLLRYLWRQGWFPPKNGVPQPISSSCKSELLNSTIMQVTSVCGGHAVLSGVYLWAEADKAEFLTLVICQWGRHVAAVCTW